MFRSNQHNTKDTVSIFSTLNSCHREFNHQSCWGCSNSHSSPCQTAQYLLENMHLSDVVLHKGALYTQMGSEQVLSLRDETWGEESSWGKAWFVQTACCMVLIIFMNTFQKSYRIWGGGGCHVSALHFFWIGNCLKLSNSMFLLYSLELKLLSSFYGAKSIVI